MAFHVPPPATLSEVADFLRRAIEKALARGKTKDLLLVGELTMRLANVAQAQEQERIRAARDAEVAATRTTGAN